MLDIVRNPQIRPLASILRDATETVKLIVYNTRIYDYFIHGEWIRGFGLLELKDYSCYEKEYKCCFMEMVLSY